MNAHVIAESAGATLLKALLNEVQQLPKPWEQTPAREQEVVIDRLRRAVESAVRTAVSSIAGANFPRIPAVVDSVTFKDGVKAVLKLSKGHEGTHALADGTGGAAMIVLASHAQFVEGIESVKADADQGDLFADSSAAEGSSSGSATEQTQAEAESWQALIDSLDQGPAEDQPEVRSMGAQCQEILARVHVHVALETCEAWTEQECTAAAYWALEYAKDPEKAPARPHWLPLPQPPTAEGDGSSEQNASDGKDGNDDEAKPRKKRRGRKGNGEARPH